MSNLKLRGGDTSKLHPLCDDSGSPAGFESANVLLSNISDIARKYSSLVKYLVKNLRSSSVVSAWGVLFFATYVFGITTYLGAET